MTMRPTDEDLDALERLLNADRLDARTKSFVWELAVKLGEETPSVPWTPEDVKLFEAVVARYQETGG